MIFSEFCMYSIMFNFRLQCVHPARDPWANHWTVSRGNWSIPQDLEHCPLLPNGHDRCSNYSILGIPLLQPLVTSLQSFGCKLPTRNGSGSSHHWTSSYPNQWSWDSWSSPNPEDSNDLEEPESLEVSHGAEGNVDGIKVFLRAPTIVGGKDESA